MQAEFIEGGPGHRCEPLVAVLTEKSTFVFTDPNDRMVKGSMYRHPSIPATIQGAVFDGLLSDGMQHPEFFDGTLLEAHELEDDTQPPHRPTFSLVTCAKAITALRAVILEYSSGHFVAEMYSRKVFKPHFNSELKTLRSWRKYTSKPTTIEGAGPVHIERIFENARYLLLKDIVAPVPSVAVMDDSDFAANQ
ncbi:hypothetical protein B0H10DRAFT_1962548 [Mycena sp. CBHHK59/15]|nr:hypothetical protein B0H10DRAFT_1962548 [Mycena sp. CBHHK59/15]